MNIRDAIGDCNVGVQADRVALLDADQTTGVRAAHDGALRVGRDPSLLGRSDGRGWQWRAVFSDRALRVGFEWADCSHCLRKGANATEVGDVTWEDRGGVSRGGAHRLRGRREGGRSDCINHWVRGCTRRQDRDRARMGRQKLAVHAEDALDEPIGK